ncbi:MAG: DUF1425 domain-containing protein [Phycisphaerales bacterium]
MRSVITRTLLFSTVLLVGCYANTMTSTQQIRKDGWLSSYANVRVIRETKVSDDLLRIDVEVENTPPFNARFNYKFEFFDAEGRLLFSPTSGYLQEQVAAGAFSTVTATASDPRAADFRLTLTNAN